MKLKIRGAISVLSLYAFMAGTSRILPLTTPVTDYETLK
jgi:hypothetical protein